MIFSYLPARDLLKCHRVNSQWRAILTSDPTLYRSLDLTNCSTGKPLNVRNVQALIRYSGGNIRSLKIRKPEQSFGIPHHISFNPYASVHLVPLFQNLERLHVVRTDPIHLDLRDQPNLILLCIVESVRHLNIEPYLGCLELQILCETARRLESLECSLKGEIDWSTQGPQDLICLAPSVKHLTIRVAETIDQIFLKILDWFPGVEEFSLIQEAVCRGTWPMPPVEIVCRSGMRTVRINGLPQHGTLSIKSNDMKRLEVSMCPLLSVDIPAQSLLQELILDIVPDVSPEILEQFHNSVTTMKMLTITSATPFEVRHIEYFLHECTHLKLININSLRYVNDTTLQLLHSLKHLEQLHIDNCPGITGQGIIRLVENLCIKRGGQLTAISVRGNENIRRQTIDWARDHRVKISI
jgi:F-box-like